MEYGAMRLRRYANVKQLDGTVSRTSQDLGLDQRKLRFTIKRKRALGPWTDMMFINGENVGVCGHNVAPPVSF